MKNNNIHQNMPYSLKVLEGSFSQQNDMSNEEPDIVYIGSDIESAHIGSERKGDFENGTGYEINWYIIIQNDKPMLVETCLESYNYGCSYMKNGGSEKYTVYDLSQVTNLK